LICNGIIGGFGSWVSLLELDSFPISSFKYLWVAVLFGSPAGREALKLRLEGKEPGMLMISL
jgi:hypothetical protein